MEPLVADFGEPLLGLWTMILVAAFLFAGLAVGLPIAIMKVIELVEALFVEMSERFRAKPGRARGLHRLRDVRSRSRRQRSVPS